MGYNYISATNPIPPILAPMNYHNFNSSWKIKSWCEPDTPWTSFESSTGEDSEIIDTSYEENNSDVHDAIDILGSFSGASNAAQQAINTIEMIQYDNSLVYESVKEMKIPLIETQETPEIKTKNVRI